MTKTELCNIGYSGRFLKIIFKNGLKLKWQQLKTLIKVLAIIYPFEHNNMAVILTIW